jgi:hypothetical protein
MTRIATLTALLLTAMTAGAQTIPPIVYDIESDFQQTQALPDQSFVQGAGVALRYRLKSQGRWLSLAGLGARWDARALSTSTQALQQAASVVTNVTPHYFQMLLTPAQTGSAVTNWTHSLIVTSGGTEYPIGVGRLDIAASAWTGDAAVLSNTKWTAYTDAAVSSHAAVKATTNSLGHIIVGDNLTVDGNGRVSAAPVVTAWGDVTGKPFTDLVDLTTDNLTGIDWGLYVTGTPWTAVGYLTAETDPVFANWLAATPPLYEYTETDPLWSAVSNTVTAGAALGATAVQPAALAGYVPTNDTRYLAALTNAAEFATVAQGALADTAWQNPAAATNWTWTSDGNQITLTGYSTNAPNDVVIPDMLDGLPVTTLGNLLFSPGIAGSAITSVSGGANVTSIGSKAFDACADLTSVSLPSATSIGENAFHSCTKLASVSLPSAKSIARRAFDACAALTSISLPSATSIGTAAFADAALASISLPNATTIGNGAFDTCTSLTSVTFSASSAPTIGTAIFADSPNVTVYVTNPTATGWGATLGGQPVVRMPLTADSLTVSGSITAASGTVAATATTGTEIVNYQTATGIVANTLAPYVAAAAGYVRTNDTRYLAALTNAAAFSPAGALPTTGGIMTGIIQDSFGAASINPSARTLHNSFEDLVSDWNSLTLYNGSVLDPRLNWGLNTLYGIWKSEGTATTGTEIVNYQTATGIVANALTPYVAAAAGYVRTNHTGNVSISGNITASGAIAGATANISGNLVVDTNTLFVDAANNRVGIGTTGPGAKLDVVSGTGYSDIGIRSTGGFVVRGDGRVDIGSSAGLNAMLSVNRTTGNPVSHIAHFRNADGLDLLLGSGATSFNLGIVGSSGQLAFGNSGVFGQQMVLDTATGNLGIGTTTPTQRLHVNGSALITSNLTVSGSITAGRYSATVTPYLIPYTNNVTISAANGMEQHITSITGAMDITFPVGATNTATKIFLTIPPYSGTNTVNLMPGPEYEFVSPLVSTNWIGTNAFTQVWMVSEYGTTNRTAVVMRGSVQ